MDDVELGKIVDILYLLYEGFFSNFIIPVFGGCKAVVDASKNGDDGDRDELIFDLIKGRIETELKRTNNLDSKAGSIVGFVSIVAGLLLGRGSLLLGGEINDLRFNLTDITSSLYFFGVALLLVSIGLSLFALRVRRWIAVPNVTTLIERYTELSYEEVLKRNAGEMAKSVRDSEKQNNTKARYLEYSWVLLILGLIITFISIIIFNYS